MFYLILFLLILVADQYTKLAIQQDMFLGQSIPLIHGFFHLTYIRNTGGAFGIMRNSTNLFIVISVIVIIFIIYFLFKEKNKDALILVFSALVLGGALSNLIDRIRLGYVIDFLDFLVWPVFNIADAAISIGVALLVLRAFITRDTPAPSEEVNE